MRRKSSIPFVLVLGAKGMVGSAVYKYFRQQSEVFTLGTDRTDADFSFLEVSSVEKDIKNIIQQNRKIDYLINAIGLLDKNTEKSSISKKDYQKVNTFFLSNLAELSNIYGYKLIHISTDAVFPPNSGSVTELDKPQPMGDYAKSKFLGEPSTQNVLTFRTSIIEANCQQTSGLLNWVYYSKEKCLTGYTNQLWAGCTALQFAQLCFDIIINNQFDKLRKSSPIYHFAPVGPLTKYQLLKTFIKISKSSKEVKKGEGKKQTRYLTSTYNVFSKYSCDINTAIKEMLQYEGLISSN